LRGLLGTSPQKRLGLVQDTLQSQEKEIQAVAAWFVRRLADDSELKSLAQQVEQCPPAAQIVLLHALAARGCRAAAPAAMRLAKQDDLAVRVAALWALGSVGDYKAIDLLAHAAVSAVGEERRAAGHSLVVLCGDRRGGETLLKWIRNCEPSVQVKFVRSFADRNATEAGPLVWRIAQEADLALGLEAIKAFGEMAAEEHSVPVLLRVFLTTSEGPRRNAVLDALKHACISARWRSANRPSVHKLTALTEVVAGEMREAAAPVTCELLPVLGCLGGESALIAVRSELRRRDDEAVRVAAIRTLADWRDDGAAAELLRIAREDESAENRRIAVQGYLRMIGLRKDRPLDETARMYGEALEIVQYKGQKLQVLSRLSGLHHVAALSVVERCLSDPQVQREACNTAIQIASNLNAEANAEVARVLGAVLKLSKDSATLKAAREVLSRRGIRPE
jgi:HEAT repeat protein